MTTLSDSAHSPPRAFQFRIATLLIAMIWVGLVCLALRTPTPIWSGITSAFTFVAIVNAALVAIYRTGHKRAAAVGFLIFTGTFVYATGSLLTPLFGLTSLPDQVFGEFGVLLHGPDKIADQYTPVRSAMPPALYQKTDFVAVCKHVFAIMFGIVGSVVARFLYSTQQRQNVTD